MNYRLFAVAVLVLGSLFAVGCRYSTSPETPAAAASPAGPQTLAEAVTQLEGIRDTIKTAFEAGTPKDCDSAVHDAWDIVEKLPALATDAGLSAEGLDGVNTAAKSLQDAMMKIHEGFHGGTADTSSYDAVKDSMNEAIASLTSLTP